MDNWKEGGVRGMKWWMDEWQRGGRVKGRAKPPLSEDRLMWVSERTPERNSPLFGSQLSDGPSGIAVCGRHPSHSSQVSFKHWLATQRWTMGDLTRPQEEQIEVSIAEGALVNLSFCQNVVSYYCLRFLFMSFCQKMDRIMEGLYEITISYSMDIGT